MVPDPSALSSLCALFYSPKGSVLPTGPLVSPPGWAFSLPVGPGFVMSTCILFIQSPQPGT